MFYILCRKGPPALGDQLIKWSLYTIYYIYALFYFSVAPRSCVLVDYIAFHTQLIREQSRSTCGKILAARYSITVTS